MIRNYEQSGCVWSYSDIHFCCHARYSGIESYIARNTLIMGSMIMESWWLLTNRLIFVDVAIVPFIRQFANIDKEWFQDNYVKLSQWLNNIIESKLFVSVMDKYLEYNSGEPPQIITFNKFLMEIKWLFQRKKHLNLKETKEDPTIVWIQWIILRTKNLEKWDYSIILI